MCSPTIHPGDWLSTSRLDFLRLLSGWVQVNDARRLVWDTMQVVVLAGGMGTRLRPWTWSTPKPALPMLDRTLIEQVVGTFGETIVEEVILAGGYMIEELRAIMGYRDLPFKLTIAEEHQPLGTGGALRNCKEHIRGPFVLSLIHI